jgi:hypothetical protein
MMTPLWEAARVRIRAAIATSAPVSNNLVAVFLLSLVAMVNPTLLAAVTVMLLMPNPKRLMLGYLLGAYTTSITTGLLIVFSLQGSTAESTAKQSVSPAADILVGSLSLAVAWVLRTGRDRAFQERRQRRRQAKLRAREEAGKPTESLPLRMLEKGDPKLTFVVGALLSYPGVSYLDALDHIHRLDAGTVATVALVLFFCLMQQIFLELPLLGYLFAPERTHDAVGRFRAWMGRSGRTAAVIVAVVTGIWLLARGIITLL